MKMISVKRAAITDLEILVPLFEAYRGFYKMQSNTVRSTAFLKARLEQRESIIFIAFWGDTPAGFVQLYPLFSSTRLQRLWLLNDLYVSSAHRQKRLGISLIQKAQKWCVTSKAAGLMLETEKNNLPGNRLYPKVGFNLDQEHNFYFWDVPD